MSDVVPRPTAEHQPRWQPIRAIDRRVLGVLVEKAKTTPDGYPMSVNSLRSGCNQKNNRYPLMELDIEDVEESLAGLRALGAVAEVQGGGRVSRFRHYMYEWLGVEKLELAVMAELLLRGAQTEGELRGRAARMDPIPDLDTLRPVLAALKEKKLVIALSPEGRGHVVTHALYEPQELEKVRREAAAGAPPHDARSEEKPRSQVAPTSATPTAAAPAPLRTHQAPPSALVNYATAQSVEQLKAELENVRTELAELRKSLDELWSNFR